ncbi:MAG: hypothetical protein M0Z52_07325 [Actinomycetota bacterium]|nr:hypothetical protein [Actinomycetota bacterium]
MSAFDIFPYWNEQGGLSGLEGVMGTVEMGPGGRIGFADTFGNFYYFTSPSNEARFSQAVGQKVEVAEDAISRTDPRMPVAGQLPWTLPGVGAPSSGNHKWRNIDLFAGIGLASLLFGPDLLSGIFGGGKKTGGRKKSAYVAPSNNGGNNAILA